MYDRHYRNFRVASCFHAIYNDDDIMFCDEQVTLQHLIKALHSLAAGGDRIEVIELK